MAEVKAVAVNRQAFHNYEILDRIEAGLVLTGTEIKSIRAGRVDLRGSYAKPQNGELFLCDVYIAPYGAGNIYNHDPKRPRKLLLHKDQLAEVIGSVSQKGVTLVPLRLYIKRRVAKVELGLARGKRQYDKRRTIIERDREREAQQAVRRSR